MPSERRCGSRPPRAPKGGSSKPERQTRRSRPFVPFGYVTLHGFGTLVYGLGGFLGDLFLLFDGGLGVHRQASVRERTVPGAVVESSLQFRTPRLGSNAA